MASPNEGGTRIPRVISVDIFRGLNVALMILVNNLAEVKGLPWWTYHRGDVNGMTYVDMVFPGFLFLMGMSIPLSVDARTSHGHTKLSIFWHIIVRSLGLLALGLFIANAPHVDSRSTHISQSWWTVLGLVAIALAWIRFPGEHQHKLLRRTLHATGLSMIAVLLMMFRRVTPEGHTAGLDFSYWEILGLLGWAYLLVSTLYLFLAKRPKLLVTSFVALLCLNVLGCLRVLYRIPHDWNPFEAGLSFLTMSGVLANLILVRNSYASTFGQKTRLVLLAVAILFAAGFALQPLGISKNHDTPTWCLYSTSANLLLALLLFWVADVKGHTTWAKSVIPAGENPLFPYMLAYVPFLLPQLYALTSIGTHGSWGVAKSAFLTVLVLAVATLLMRRGLRLRV